MFPPWYLILPYCLCSLILPCCHKILVLVLPLSSIWLGWTPPSWNALSSLAFMLYLDLPPRYLDFCPLQIHLLPVLQVLWAPQELSLSALLSLHSLPCWSQEHVFNYYCAKYVIFYISISDYSWTSNCCTQLPDWYPQWDDQKALQTQNVSKELESVYSITKV